MRYQQNAVLSSLRRAQQFFDANASVLVDVNPSARRELDDVVTQLTSLSIAQESGARGSKGETAHQHALRVALRRNTMAPIAQVAKYKLQAVPEFAALALPPTSISADSEVAAAYAMADAATPYVQTLLDNGLSAACLDNLRAAAAAVNTSLVDRSNLQGRRNGATAGLAATETRGRALLRVLNAIVLGHVGDDAQLLREWTTAKTVRHKPGPAAGSHAAAPTPTLVSTLSSTSTPPAPPAQAATPAPTIAPVAVAA